MTDAQKKLVELDMKKAEIKRFFEEYNEAIAAVVTEQGLGSLFQDGEGVVYKTVIPEGKFVYFDKLGVNRTRRLSQDEKRGDLSLTAARDAGFIVEGK